MQDKFAIGPVTIVQLVGLNAKPRIASTHVDAAVRAADLLPPTSAAAGIGNDLQDNVSEVASIYFDIKAPQMLSLTAAPMRGSISFEAGVDRPVAENGGPPPSLPQSNFDGLSNNIDLAALIASVRGAPTTATPPSDASNGSTPPTVEATPPVVSGDATVIGSPDAGPGTADIGDENDFIFDGAEAFGDDKILDFEAYYAASGLVSSDPLFITDAGDFDAVVDTVDYFATDVGQYFMIDAAGEVVPEPALLGHHEFASPQYQPSIGDAIQPI